MAGRTRWVPKDVEWLLRGRIRKLGRRFGPAGPLVIDYLIASAKTQGPARNHDGTVKSSLTTIADICFLDDEEVTRQIIEYAAEVSALDDLHIANDETFTCRISGWHDDVEKPLAATRKAGQRQVETGGDNEGQTGGSGDDPGLSPNVPEPARNVPLQRQGQERKPSGTSVPVKFKGRVVAAERLADAAAVLDRFNDLAGTRYGPLTGRGQPSKNLSRILGAFAADDEWTRERAVRAVELEFERPDSLVHRDTPHLGMVFGDGMRDTSLERVRAAVKPTNQFREQALKRARTDLEIGVFDQAGYRARLAEIDEQHGTERKAS